MIVAGVLLVLVLLFVVGGRGADTKEGFLTLDPPTQLAQRQQLQWEGERRYNDFARLQSTLAALPADQIQSAVQQAVPTPTSGTASLLSLLGSSSGLSGIDDGSGKSGPGVENTGLVQEKINFCESQKSLDCTQLNDPRMAECGICLDGGKNSKGNFHRGGMYISSDDQIRANEVSNSNGQPAVYQPTVGSCPAQNFVLMQPNCQARINQLACVQTPAATASNQCGQCYGSAPSGYSGTLFVGPKPAVYDAYLNVSHPGGHGGLTVTANGQTFSLGPSNAAVLNYTSLYLPGVQEGMNVQITLSGCPKVWAAWLSNRPNYDPSDATARTVSLDVGLQSMSPANAYELAGDQRAPAIQQAVNALGGGTVQSPNTVMWFMRRDEVVQPIITSAWYGATPNPSDGQGIDLTPYIKQLAGQAQDIPVSTESLQTTDPAYGTYKHLFITQDNGTVISAGEGNTIYQSRTTSNVVLNVTVPATLLGPMYADDAAACPSGPMVFTEIGAGLMGSHSCFKPDGSFNPNQYCLQEMFQGAGGSQQGAGWPGSDTAVAALLSAAATGLGVAQSAITLDQMTAWLNNLGSIANYGTDSAGNDAPFDTYKAACQFMLGFVPLNPCQGPSAATGPHTPECLDYLYRTSGDPSMDGVAVDPTSLPYNYCGPAGGFAPLNPDGSVNQGNVSMANQYGALANIRGFYQGLFNKSQDSSNFDNQAAAMRNCFGTNLQPPVTPPSACPPPAPDQWQCVSPGSLQQAEVFQVSVNGYTTPQSGAEAVCATYNARVATTAQLTAAQQAGADWCSTGWVSDSNTAMYPITTSTGPGCGGGGTGIMQWTPPSGNAAVNCYGVKPPFGTAQVLGFNQTRWNQSASATQSSSGQAQSIGVTGNGNAVFLDQGGLTTIAIGEDGVPWGTENSDDTIWTKYNNNLFGPWQQVGGALVQVDARDNNHIVGVNAGNIIYMWNGPAGWLNITAQSGGWQASWASMGTDGTFYCIGLDQHVYKFNGNGNNSTWSWVAGGVATQVSVGDANNVWCVNGQGYIYQLQGGGTNWKEMGAGQAIYTRVAVAADGSVAAVTNQGGVSLWNGSSFQPLQLPSQVGRVLNIGLSTQYLAITNQGNQIFWVALSDNSTFYAMREINRQIGDGPAGVQCLTGNGTDCFPFTSATDCGNWVNGDTTTFNGGAPQAITPPSGNLASLFDQKIRNSL